MKRLRYLIFVFFFTIAFYLFNSLSPIFYKSNFGTNRRVKDFKVTGHRGAAGLSPENSLEAIQKAVDLKTDRIEIDVQQTKDNRIVVIHDYTVDRTTNGKGAVKDLSFDEIRSLFIKENNKKITELKIPTLDEVIDKMDSGSVLLIEIKKEKGLYPGIERRVIDIINKHNAKSKCILQSFNDEVLQNIHTIDPTIGLHKLLIAKLPFFNFIFDGSFKCKKFTDYSFVKEFSINYVFANKSVIDEIHKLNKKINVWTVDDNATMKKLMDLGVDGIITNYPDRVKKY